MKNLGIIFKPLGQYGGRAYFKELFKSGEPRTSYFMLYCAKCGISKEVESGEQI